MGPLVLEPELDLERLQPQLPAQLLALLVVRVRALLEEPAYTYINTHQYTHITSCIVPIFNAATEKQVTNIKFHETCIPDLIIAAKKPEKITMKSSSVNCELVRRP